MNLEELLQNCTIWFGWGGLGLGFMTIISFLIGWGAKFRLVGATIFSLLISISSWAFLASYTPPLIVEGALYAPIVFDNGTDLVVAQASNALTEESVLPTLEQIAGNLKGRGERNTIVNVRLRKFESDDNGISRPIIVGEVKRDIRNKITIQQSINKNEDQ